MGLVVKNSLKYSAVLYIGIVLGYINTILVFPNILSQNEFGLTRLLIAVSAITAHFAQLGTPNIAIKFFPEFKGEKVNPVFSLILIIGTIGAIIGSAILLFCKDLIIEIYAENALLFTEYYFLLVPFFLFFLYFNLLDAYLRILHHNTFTNFLNQIFLRLLWLVLTILLYYEYVNIKTYFILFVAAQGATTLIVLGYIIFIGKFKITPNLQKLGSKFFKYVGTFGLFSILSGFSAFVINKIDILMLGSYIGLSSVAVYSIAFYMSTVILVPSRSIGRTTLVLISEALHKNNRPQVSSLYQKSALNQLIFGWLIFSLILINYDHILRFLPENYINSFYPFLFLGIAKLVETSFGPSGAIIVNSRYFKFDTLFAFLLMVVTIFTNMLLIPLYGITGAAVATALSLVAYNLLRYSFIKKKLGFTPFSLGFLKALVICLLALLTVYFIPKIGPWYLDLLLRSFIFVLVLFLPVYKSNLSPEFNEVINRLKSKVM